jgi:hypothetical protein
MILRLLLNIYTFYESGYDGEKLEFYHGVEGDGNISLANDSIKFSYIIYDTWNYRLFQMNCIGIKTASINKKIDEYILYQNVPNPFSESTVIKYFLLENIQDAKLCITDILGNNIKTFELQSNDGCIVLDNVDFASGIYYYTLYLNNQNIETKQMIINK